MGGSTKGGGREGGREAGRGEEEGLPMAEIHGSQKDPLEVFAFLEALENHLGREGGREGGRKGGKDGGG